jgi:hypothetical protein
VIGGPGLIAIYGDVLSNNVLIPSNVGEDILIALETASLRKESHLEKGTAVECYEVYFLARQERLRQDK